MKKYLFIFLSIIVCLAVFSCRNNNQSESTEDNRTNHEYFQDQGWSYIGTYKPYILVDDRVGKSTAGSYYLYRQGIPGHEYYGILEDSWARGKRSPKVHMQELILGNYRFPEYRNGEKIGYRSFNAHFGNLYFEL